MTTGPPGKSPQPLFWFLPPWLSFACSKPVLAVFVVQSLSRVQLFCDPMDCSPPGSSVHGNFLAKIAGVGCCFLLRGIFPTQGLNLHIRVSCTAGKLFAAGPPGKAYIKRTQTIHSLAFGFFKSSHCLGIHGAVDTIICSFFLLGALLLYTRAVLVYPPSVNIWFWINVGMPGWGT